MSLINLLMRSDKSSLYNFQPTYFANLQIMWRKCEFLGKFETFFNLIYNRVQKLSRYNYETE